MKLYRDIEKGIKKGLEITCKDAVTFNGPFYAKVKPEYLITVNISKAISDMNVLPGSPFMIRPEEGTRIFATRCVPNIKWENFFETTIFREDQNTCRNGRFDVAIYNEDEEKPLTAIEVKLLNPTCDGIKDDILRLSELLHLSDNQTGPSKIAHTYFACIELDEEIKFQEQVLDHRRDVKTKYEIWMQQILEEKHNTKFEVASISIDDSLILTAEKITGDNIFDGDQYSLARHFIGVIVRLTKK